MGLDAVDSVGFLACGWSLASEETHGQAIAVRTPDQVLLFDAGGGVSKGLVQTFGTDALSHIYLTHEHPDHTWGLMGLVHHLRFAGKPESLAVHGPPRTLERCREALDMLGVTCPFALDWVPISTKSKGEDARVQWAPTEHTVPTLAYRVGDVTICGDTAPTSTVARLAAGSSLLVHEASHTDEDLTHESGHSTPADAGWVATEAGVDTLALIHIHPSLGRAGALKACPFEATIAPKDGEVYRRSESTWTQDSSYTS